MYLQPLLSVVLVVVTVSLGLHFYPFLTVVLVVLAGDGLDGSAPQALRAGGDGELLPDDRPLHHPQHLCRYVHTTYTAGADPDCRFQLKRNRNSVKIRLPRETCSEQNYLVKNSKLVRREFLVQRNIISPVTSKEYSLLRALLSAYSEAV